MTHPLDRLAALEAMPGQLDTKEALVHWYCTHRKTLIAALTATVDTFHDNHAGAMEELGYRKRLAPSVDNDPGIRISPSFSFNRVLNWATLQPRKAAHLSFTEGADRDAAYLIEAYDGAKQALLRLRGE